MHADWPWTVQPGTFYTSNTLWMLDDITEENGPTRVIPGTHFTGKLPNEELSDLRAPHPDEVHVTGKAGSVLILNGHVWHGGTTNKSGESRQLIQSYFVHKAHHPQQFQHLLITPETRARLNDDALKILDIPIYQN
jgi:ectoine hydroxylase-related dioxygenase (phytanoyl-CoA dioxygenase family)